MDIFAKGTKLKLRFSVPVPQTEVEPVGGYARGFSVKSKGLSGNLSIEELWDLESATKRSLKASLRREVKDLEEDEDDLTPSEKQALSLARLKLQILEEVIRLLAEEAEAVKAKAAEKARNAKIDEWIERKKDGQMEGMTLEELQALRKG